jgi:hypothetical protein
MTSGIYGSIFKRLQSKELILPYFEHAMLADRWPESYSVLIDSSPYYGHNDGYFHPSSHAMMGARELYYRFHPDTRDLVLIEKRMLQSHMTLAIGSALHGVLQTQMQMAGLVKPKNIEWEYVNSEHNVRGRIDWIVDHPTGQEIPVEMKTMNHYKFDKQTEIKPSWDAQLSIGLDNFGADFGILLLVETGYPFHMREFRVPRNDQLLSEIYRKFDYVRECIELNTPPKHCCPYDSLTMKACQARVVCYLAEEIGESQ